MREGLSVRSRFNCKSKHLSTRHATSKKLAMDTPNAPRIAQIRKYEKSHAVGARRALLIEVDLVTKTHPLPYRETISEHPLECSEGTWESVIPVRA